MIGQLPVHKDPYCGRPLQNTTPIFDCRPNMSRPILLTGLTQREAITDTLYRVLIGLDHHDIPMFNSAFAGNGEDAIFLFRGNRIKGRDNIKAEIIDVVGPMVTTHMITNVRIDIKEDGKTAALNCYVLGQHAPPKTGEENDGPKWIVGAEYFVDLIKDNSDGLWKFAKWEINVLWTQGNSLAIPRVTGN
jgi:hypothetical protein